MPQSPDFVQECPICGIHLTIQNAYAGRRVVCQHCHAWFTADDPQHPEVHLSDSGLMRRVDRLLNLAGVMNGE